MGDLVDAGDHYRAYSCGCGAEWGLRITSVEDARQRFVMHRPCPRCNDKELLGEDAELLMEMPDEEDVQRSLKRAALEAWKRMCGDGLAVRVRRSAKWAELTPAVPRRPGPMEIVGTASKGAVQLLLDQGLLQQRPSGMYCISGRSLDLWHAGRIPSLGQGQ